MKNLLKLILTVAFICSLAVTFVFCGKNKGDSQSTVESTSQPSVESQQESQSEKESTLPDLEFTEKHIELVVGASRQLNISNLESGETVEYESVDSNIVSVNSNGLITANAVGTVIVKAHSSLGRMALTQVVVHDPNSYPAPYIYVVSDDLSLRVGDVYTINYTFTYLGEPIEGNVSITSENTQIVDIENGKISCVGVGVTYVVLTGNSSYGTVEQRIKVTVDASQRELYLSVAGKDIYVGQNIDLKVFVQENASLSEVANVEYTVLDESVAYVSNGQLVPIAGGNTAVLAIFTYDGREYELSEDIHVYAPHLCTVKYVDGTIDNQFEAMYGDNVQLVLNNELDNPEYNKGVKEWYVDGELYTEEYFVMPDRDVEVLVRLNNQTSDNFVGDFSEGHLLNDLSASVEYIEGTFEDSDGATSDLAGYVKLTSISWSSLVYNFDETITVNEYSTVRMRIWVDRASVLLYFGNAKNNKFDQANPTKRYEATIGEHMSGDVPFARIPQEKWIVLEMPLSAFVDVGNDLEGISICVSSNSYILIDYISVYTALDKTDSNYADNLFFSAITSEENGSSAQATAIAEYYNWSKALTEEQRQSASHQNNVASIRNIMNNHFADGVSFYVDNVPTITGGLYTGDQANTSFCHTGYASSQYNHFYMTQLNSAPHDLTVTLNLYDYNAMGEVYFGMFLVMANVSDSPWVKANATLTINGQTYAVDSSKGYYFKVAISGGVLTLYADEVFAPEVIFTTTLSEDVCNGNQALTISINCETWSQFEITDLCKPLTANDII